MNAIFHYVKNDNITVVAIVKNCVFRQLKTNQSKNTYVNKLIQFNPVYYYFKSTISQYKLNFISKVFK